MKILVTGANGFIGTELCKALARLNLDVVAVVRQPKSTDKNAQFVFKELNASTNWQDNLKNIDVVIHLAGRAHILKEVAAYPYQEFESINVDATKNLALQAAMNGAKRFIFVSSIGVNGNQTSIPYNESQVPNPQELYAISKKKAEDELWNIAKKTDLEVVIIRPPLVYGNGAKGNFEKLTKLCSHKIPLPLGAIHNKRSLIYVENLVDFIILCINHPKAANETFVISDDDDVSTSDLIRSTIETKGKKALLIPIPQNMLYTLLKLIGKKDLYIKLCGNLQVDISKAKTLLGWKPPFSFKDGIARTVQIDK
jgi:nucleoside-diphosphate-sugar epimerase